MTADALAAPEARARLQLVSSREVLIPARSHWPDLMRVSAVFWVVMIHISAVPATQIRTIAIDWWWWADLYNATSRAAVPLFIMLSGALLLTRPERDWRRFAFRRVSKVLIPLVAWTLLYVGWRILLRGDRYTLGDVIHHLVNGMAEPVYPHLWFLYLILGLYLVVPILRSFALNAPLGVHLYIAALWLLAQIARPLWQGKWAWFVGCDIESFLGCVGYFLLGATIERFVPSRLTRVSSALCAIVFVSGSALAAVGTYFLTEPTGVLDEALLAPLAPNIMLMSGAAFLLIRDAGTRLSSSAAKVVGFCGSAAYGVYLVHPAIIDVADLAGFHLHPPAYGLSWYTPLLSLGVFALSLTIATAMQRTRLLVWLAP